LSILLFMCASELSGSPFATNMVTELSARLTLLAGLLIESTHCVLIELVEKDGKNTICFGKLVESGNVVAQIDVASLDTKEMLAWTGNYLICRELVPKEVEEYRIRHAEDIAGKKNFRVVIGSDGSVKSVALRVFCFNLKLKDDKHGHFFNKAAITSFKHTNGFELFRDPNMFDPDWLSEEEDFDNTQMGDVPATQFVDPEADKDLETMDILFQARVASQEAAIKKYLNCTQPEAKNWHTLYVNEIHMYSRRCISACFLLAKRLKFIDCIFMDFIDLHKERFSVPLAYWQQLLGASSLDALQKIADSMHTMDEEALKKSIRYPSFIAWVTSSLSASSGSAASPPPGANDRASVTMDQTLHTVTLCLHQFRVRSSSDVTVNIPAYSTTVTIRASLSDDSIAIRKFSMGNIVQNKDTPQIVVSQDTVEITFRKKTGFMWPGTLFQEIDSDSAPPSRGRGRGRGRGLGRGQGNDNDGQDRDDSSGRGRGRGRGRDDGGLRASLQWRRRASFGDGGDQSFSLGDGDDDDDDDEGEAVPWRAKGRAKTLPNKNTSQRCFFLSLLAALLAVPPHCMAHIATAASQIERMTEQQKEEQRLAADLVMRAVDAYGKNEIIKNDAKIFARYGLRGARDHTHCDAAELLSKLYSELQVPETVINFADYYTFANAKLKNGSPLVRVLSSTDNLLPLVLPPAALDHDSDLEDTEALSTKLTDLLLSRSAPSIDMSPTTDGLARVKLRDDEIVLCCPETSVLQDDKDIQKT
jgi:hypothetical protein